MTGHVRAALFSAVWSIIYQLHNCRQLLLKLGKSSGRVGPKTSALLAILEGATILRNDMVHLNNNLGNLASKKGFRSALFGTISYVHCDTFPITHVQSVVVQSGLFYERENWTIINPAGRDFTPPVDLFALRAFDRDYEIGPAIAALADWLDHAVPDIEEQTICQMKEVAERGESTLEQLMTHHGSGFLLAVDIDFSDPQA